MYLGRTLAVVGTTYIIMHTVVGSWTCYTQFCPGDSETDWVYEYTDDSGKKFIVEDGRTIPAEHYQELK